MAKKTKRTPKSKNSNQTPGPLRAGAVTLTPEQAALFAVGTEHAVVLAANGDATALCGQATDPRSQADAVLYAAAPETAAERDRLREINAELLEEMRRALVVLARAEADPALWSQLTKGTGIATLNGYRAAIKKAEGLAQG